MFVIVNNADSLRIKEKIEILKRERYLALCSRGFWKQKFQPYHRS